LHGHKYFHPAISATILSHPLNQSTHPADGFIYRHSQFAWIDKHTFPSVVDLKFGLAIQIDFSAWIGTSDRIETERAFYSGLFWVNSKIFFPEGTCLIRRSSLKGLTLGHFGTDSCHINRNPRFGVFGALSGIMGN
jgi:hypothetical protein